MKCKLHSKSSKPDGRTKKRASKTAQRQASRARAAAAAPAAGLPSSRLLQPQQQPR